MTVRDYTAFLQAEIDAHAGGVLDLRGRTYRIDSQVLITRPIVLQNGTLDFRLAPSDASEGLLRANGSIESGPGTAWNLASTAVAGQSDVTLNDASTIAVDDWLYLTSNDLWSPVAGASGNLYGEWVHVRAKAGNVLTLHQKLHLTYDTAQSAKAQRVAWLEDVSIRNLKCIGRNTTRVVSTDTTQAQQAILFNYCRNARVENVTTEYFALGGLNFRNCKDSVVSGSTFRFGFRDGFSYGVLIEERTEDIQVLACIGQDLRHLVTCGGTSGVIRGIRGLQCQGVEMRDALMDSHAAADDVDFSHNTVTMADKLAEGPGLETSSTAIISEAARLTAVGNICKNVKGLGIFYQPLQTAGIPKTCLITNNDISGEITENEMITGILVLTPLSGASGEVSGVVVSNNRVYMPTDSGIFIKAQYQHIKRVSIVGNTVTVNPNSTVGGARGIRFLADSVNESGPVPAGNGNITHAVISGNTINHLGGSGTAYGIDLVATHRTAPSTVDSVLQDIVVSGNICAGGTAGLRLGATRSATDQIARVRVADCIFQNAAVGLIGATDGTQLSHGAIWDGGAITGGQNDGTGWRDEEEAPV